MGVCRGKHGKFRKYGTGIRALQTSITPGLAVAKDCGLANLAAIGRSYGKLRLTNTGLDSQVSGLQARRHV